MSIREFYHHSWELLNEEYRRSISDNVCLFSHGRGSAQRDGESLRNKQRALNGFSTVAPVAQRDIDNSPGNARDNRIHRCPRYNLLCTI